MPTVKLSNYECRKDLLPDVCMMCGSPATTRVKRNFSWHPEWVYLLILINLILTVIVAVILTKKMTVRMPVCDHHAGHWRRRTTTLLVSFLAVGLLCVGGIAYITSQPPVVADDLYGWVCGGGALLFFAWIVLAAVYSSFGVRAVQITETTIKLGRVNEEFVNALREERAREREVGRERGDRYGDERDDYDDGRQDEPRRRARPRDDDYDDRPRSRRRERDDDEYY